MFDTLIHARTTVWTVAPDDDGHRIAVFVDKSLTRDEARSLAADLLAAADALREPSWMEAL